MKTKIITLIALLIAGGLNMYAQDKKILVAYFSWSGNTQYVAEQEKEDNARPAIKNKVEDWDSYDTVFIGCPVWWWTAPMIINTFTESYDFKGKTVIPFCTYASTYRDETLAKIVELTPDAKHLKGFGAVSRNTDGIGGWLKEIKIVK